MQHCCKQKKMIVPLWSIFEVCYFITLFCNAKIMPKGFS